MAMLTLPPSVERICSFAIHSLLKENTDYSKTIFYITKMYLNALNSKNSVKGISSNRPKRVKRKKADGYKEFLRLRRPIIITDKQNRKSLGSPNDKIDWSYRWEVRGHWRKLISPESLGKDPNGEYKIKGYTWVKPYDKGPEDKVKLSRKRVVVANTLGKKQ